MRSWLVEQIIPVFEGRTLTINLPTVLICATLHVPKNRPERDALIAATALHHQLVMATRNIRDFMGTGLTLLNPWTG